MSIQFLKFKKQRSAQPNNSLSHKSAELFFGMAGMVGFEPTNDGVKVRCLTAWLHPNIEFKKGGVDDGTQTHDLQSHNLAL